MGYKICYYIRYVVSVHDGQQVAHTILTAKLVMFQDQFILI